MTTTHAPTCETCGDTMVLAGLAGRQYWLSPSCGAVLIDQALITELPHSAMDTPEGNAAVEAFVDIMNQRDLDLARILLSRSRGAAHSAINSFSVDYDETLEPAQVDPFLMTHIYVGLAVEWIVRFAIFKFDPTLLADRNHPQSAVNFSKLRRGLIERYSSYRSSNFEGAVQLFRQIYPDVKLNREIDEVMSARNQSVHIAMPPGEPGDYGMLASMVRIIDTVLAQFNVPTDEFWEENAEDALIELRSSEMNYVRLAFECRLLRARRAWHDLSWWRPEDQVDQIRWGMEATAPDLVDISIGGDTVRRQCPVDGSVGELHIEFVHGDVAANGQTVGPGETLATSFDSGDVWAAPSTFRCLVCGLELEKNTGLEYIEEFRAFRWPPPPGGW